MRIQREKQQGSASNNRGRTKLLIYEIKAMKGREYIIVKKKKVQKSASNAKKHLQHRTGNH